MIDERGILEMTAEELFAEAERRLGLAIADGTPKKTREEHILVRDVVIKRLEHLSKDGK